MLLCYCSSHAQYILPENFNSIKEPSTGPAEEEGTVYIIPRPHSGNAIFTGEGAVGYTVKLMNAYNKPQDGVLKCTVITEEGVKVYEDSVKVNINKQATNRYKFSIPCKNAGFYKISFGVSLTFYDDTVKRVFGYNPKQITATTHIPDDFDAFWKATRDSLKKIPPHFRITKEPALSVNDQTVYLIEMQSWG